MPEPLPAFYDDLDETLAEAFRRLSRGVADRRAPFHTPVVATVGREGPRARVMVLRGFDAATRTLRVHTDIRSAKAEELAQGVALCFYDAPAKIQIRVEGEGRLHHGDEIAAAAWAASQTMSRVCYGTMPAPGAPIPSGGDFTLSQETETEGGEAHFAALVVTIRRLEWLYLARIGHRRATFTWDGKGSPKGQWRAP
jgi:hypothetical protein